MGGPISRAFAGSEEVVTTQCLRVLRISRSTFLRLDVSDRMIRRVLESKKLKDHAGITDREADSTYYMQDRSRGKHHQGYLSHG